LTSDSYDDNGSTIDADGKTFTYDYKHRIIGVTAPNLNISIVYNGDGDRVRKTVNGVTTDYLVNRNNHTGYAQVVEEIQNGIVTRQYTHGLDLISQRQLINGNRITHFYGYDGHGSVRYLTDTNGVITDTYDFDGYGNLINQTGSTPNNYLYAGEQFDHDLGLYYNRARYLDVNRGRFWTQDSFEGLNGQPLSLHKYLYGHGDPVNNVDPSGQITIATFAVAETVSGILDNRPTRTNGSNVLGDGYVQLKDQKLEEQFKKLQQYLDGNITSQCQKRVIDVLTKSTPFTLETFRSYLALGVNFYNGEKSEVPLLGGLLTQEDYDDLEKQIGSARIKQIPTVKARFEKVPSELVLTSRTAKKLTFFARPKFYEKVAFSDKEIQAFFFHEALHGYGGYMKFAGFKDSDLQGYFELPQEQSTLKLNDHIFINCFTSIR